MVLPDSCRISRVRHYSGTHYCLKLISNTRLSRSVAPLSRSFFYQIQEDVVVLQPRLRRFGLYPLRSSLLRASLLISFLRLLRYFSSPTSLHELNGFGLMVSRKAGWVSPFGDIRVIACLRARRIFSHSATSFFGCVSQGIRYMLVSNFFKICLSFGKQITENIQ